EFGAVVETARELGLAVHLDGARIANAAVALGVPAAAWGRQCDTVTLCLAEGWEARGVPVDVDRVETNFVQIDVGALGLERAEALARLEAEGVGLTGTVIPGVLRALTHLDLTDDDVERAIELVPRALGVPARPSRRSGYRSPTSP